MGCSTSLTAVVKNLLSALFLSAFAIGCAHKGEASRPEPNDVLREGQVKFRAAADQNGSTPDELQHPALDPANILEKARSDFWIEANQVEATTTGQRFEQFRKQTRIGELNYPAEAIRRESSKTIWLIPQYHPSPTFPAIWCQIGQEIAAVQSLIAMLLFDLSSSFGVRHIGLEGRSASHIESSPNLERALSKLSSLQFHIDKLQKGESKHVVEEMGGADSIKLIQAKLAPFIERYLQGWGGTGLPLLISRGLVKDGYKPIFKFFGMDDPHKTAKAIELINQIDEVRQQLNRLVPPQGQDGAPSLKGDYTAQVWLSEYPSFNDDVIKPVGTALQSLRRNERQLEKDGYTELGETISSIRKRLSTLYSSVLRPEDITSRYYYYQAVEKSILEWEEQEISDVSSDNEVEPDAARVKKLQETLRELETKYHQVSIVERNRVFANRILERLEESSIDQVALVVGANHLRGIEQAFESELAENVGWIVVNPFPHALPK